MLYEVITITRLAAATRHPWRVIGLHFFNPVPMMGLVEVVRGVQTADSVAAVAEAVVRRLGKEPVKAANRPGFVVNRLLCPMINEAIRITSYNVCYTKLLRLNLILHLAI